MSAVVLRWLGKPKRVSFILLMNVYFVRIYDVARRRFEGIFKASCEDQRKRWVHQSRAVGLEKEAMSGENVGNGGEQSWQWRGYPKLPRAIDLYDRLSNSYMLFVVLRNNFPGPFLKLIKLFPLTLPAHCYLVGRFVLFDSIHEISGSLFSAFHLCWRLSQWYLDRPYNLNLINFFLISDHDTRRFLEMIKRKKKMAEDWRQPETSQKALVVRQIMCYQVVRESGRVFRLRPNRSFESRQDLCKAIVSTTLMVSLSFGLAALGITTYILLTILLDRRYVKVYPNCDPHLQVLEVAGELADWSITPWGHHLVSGLIDGAENIIVWVDSGLAISFTWAFVYILNYDLMLYWRHLHSRLETLLARIRTESGPWLVSTRLRGSNLAHYEDKSSLDFLRDISLDVKMKFRHSAQSADLMAVWPRLHNWQALELEEQVEEVQALLCDFFRQIGAVDLIISDILTAAITIWLTTFAIYGRFSAGYYTNRRQGCRLPLLIMALQLITFFGVSSATASLLGLNRCCMRSYQVICSIMALDRSRRRRRFLRILDFYTKNKRPFYTLFQQYPFKATTFISILGWSISCFLIFDGLLRR